MKTKSVTYSESNNDNMPKLDYKWWFETNKFWAKNDISGFKPDSFIERAEMYINNGEVSREKVFKDLDELNEIAKAVKSKRGCSAAETAVFDYFRK